jgi:extracellular factor (EF) 3-hydroxypalmitic acid methyl ester biosynthesis protein
MGAENLVPSLGAQKELSLTGELEDGANVLPVRLQCASRTTLTVSFPEGRAPADRTVFPRLRVQLPHGEAQLTRCRLQRDATSEGAGHRLVFLDDVYDCRSLVHERKLLTVRSSFQNVPLVLAQKERIRPAFRQYTADLLYDLSAYKKLFGEQDHLFAQEPHDAAGDGALEARQALLASEGQRFFQFLDAHLEELDRQVRDFDKEEHERHGFYLRRLAWEFILCSELFKRTNLKPRGYAGDAEMMVMLYENALVGPTLFHQLMHKHALGRPAAQAVRNRRGLVAGLLGEVRARFAGQPVRFLSLAAGPAWELQDIFRGPEDLASLRCVLLDQDPHALACARETVRRVEQQCGGGKLDVSYHSDSVRTMIGKRTAVQRLGRSHFVYSMGLFDYLTPPVARAVLGRMYELLEPGGSLVVGNYHVSNPDRYYMAYWADWVLYHRTEAEFLALAETLPGARARVGFDTSGCQMFLRVDKQG